jgi:hypothetical protein
MFLIITVVRQSALEAIETKSNVNDLFCPFTVLGIEFLVVSNLKGIAFIDKLGG